MGNAGELPVEPQETYLDLGPDFRFATPGNREEWGEFAFSGAPTVAVLETVIGGLSTTATAPSRSPTAASPSPPCFPSPATDRRFPNRRFKVAARVNVPSIARTTRAKNRRRATAKTLC